MDDVGQIKQMSTSLFSPSVRNERLIMQVFEGLLSEMNMNPE